MGNKHELCCKGNVCTEAGKQSVSVFSTLQSVKRFKLKYMQTLLVPKAIYGPSALFKYTNQLDVVMVDKEKMEVLIINKAISCDSNIRKKEHEKYQEL